MSIARRCIVHGRVQGVFFRDTTRHKAVDLGINGFVRNLPDRTVEVVACGKDDAVNALCEWLWQGPGSARVDDVVCEAHELITVNGFEVR